MDTSSSPITSAVDDQAVVLGAEAKSPSGRSHINGVELSEDESENIPESVLSPGTHDHATQPTEHKTPTSDGGQVPAPEPSSSTLPENSEPITSKSEPQAAVAEPTQAGDKHEEGSLSPTLTGAQSQARSSRRNANKSATSEGGSNAHMTTDKLNGNGKPKVPNIVQPPKPSFLSKLIRKLIPCIGPSSRSHPIELQETVSEPKERDHKEAVVSEPPLAPPKDLPIEPEVPEPSETEAEASISALTAPTLIVSQISAEPEPDVILPPTPTTHLLPQAETEGVTSGAVQAPGSTGGSSIHHEHRDKSHNRDSVGRTGVEGEESDGTSFTEDEDLDDGNNVDEAEDDEDRLIMNGGAGIPIGPDGVPKPLLPPIAPQHAGRKCLVLDLDETLVHSSFKSIQQADYVVPVEIEFHWHNVYVIKRPGVDNFLKKMGEIYEVVVFTASLSKYADPVLDRLDIHQVVSHRLFRESCYNHQGNYVKDLSQLGRPIADTIILDNSPASYIFHPNNAVPVSSWFNDPHDTELTDLVPFLGDLSSTDDVRGVLDGAR